MTDPWDIAAQDIIDRRAEQARKDEAAERARLAKQAAEQAAADATYRDMKAAISEAVPQLTRFLNERGPAAQRLLEAYSERTHIMFGADQGGGFYSSVFLHGTGLRHEHGTAGGYGGTPKGNRPATPQEAVEAFARYGRGYNNPQQVRDIVRWLTEQIDAYSRHNC